MALQMAGLGGLARATIMEWLEQIPGVVGRYAESISIDFEYRIKLSSQ